MFGFKDRLAILMYHRVLARPDPLRPWDVDTLAFDGQMRMLARYFNVLPLPEAARRLQEGALPPRAVCVTFDDGYADNYTLALPILQKYKLTATFFIATGFLNGGRMWNDTVIEALARAGGQVLSLEHLGLGVYSIATAQERLQAVKDLLGKVKYLSVAERLSQAGRIAEYVGQTLPHDLMMTTQELRKLHGAGMEIGAHTVNHPILVHTSPDQAEREIVAGRQWLREALDDDITTFAYPNGRPGSDYALQHMQIVQRAGFEVAVSTAWGAARRGMDRYQLARIAPWDRTSFGFGLRVLRTYFEPAPALL